MSSTSSHQHKSQTFYDFFFLYFFHSGSAEARWLEGENKRKINMKGGLVPSHSAEGESVHTVSSGGLIRPHHIHMTLNALCVCVCACVWKLLLDDVTASLLQVWGKQLIHIAAGWWGRGLWGWGGDNTQSKLIGWRVEQPGEAPRLLCIHLHKDGAAGSGRTSCCCVLFIF